VRLDQGARTMGSETSWAGFDLFISYAHADDQEKVSALVAAIKADTFT
jgi:hypothetical protein